MRQPKYDCVATLQTLGITYQDAEALRRVSMTLNRWHELECGDGNEDGSWAIVRGTKHKGNFSHDDNGHAFLEHHHYLHGRGLDYVSYTLVPDRERGALNRLRSIMLRYPTLSYYVQTDPRGAALYILRPGDVPEGEDASSYYSRGIVVCK